jgi:hypothetical protein
MAEQKSRAIGEFTVNVDVSDGLKNLKKLQKELRMTVQLIKEFENEFSIMKENLSKLHEE